MHVLGPLCALGPPFRTELVGVLSEYVLVTILGDGTNADWCVFWYPDPSDHKVGRRAAEAERQWKGPTSSTPLLQPASMAIPGSEST